MSHFFSHNVAPKRCHGRGQKLRDVTHWLPHNMSRISPFSRQWCWMCNNMNKPMKVKMRKRDCTKHSIAFKAITFRPVQIFAQRLQILTIPLNLENESNGYYRRHHQRRRQIGPNTSDSCCPAEDLSEKVSCQWKLIRRSTVLRTLREPVLPWVNLEKKQRNKDILSEFSYNHGFNYWL